MTLDLFDEFENEGAVRREQLASQAFVLRNFALPQAPQLLTAVESVQQRAPFRFLTTPSGLRMSVAMTSCGPWGWMSDRRGYRYAPQDPHSDLPWPAMPAVFMQLATAAAAEAGFDGFMPDACLINRYAPGARLSLHQDKDEVDFSAPIVSVSLGVPAMFLFGGLQRTDKTVRVPLFHGDVVVWGGVDRLRYHGILPLKEARHAMTASFRFNLTFRKVLQ
jgi:alkylated DNA repair protein (DNA oxidative demethylase)